MKRPLLYILIILIVLSLSSCNEELNTSQSTAPPVENSSSVIIDPTPTPNPAAKPEEMQISLTEINKPKYIDDIAINKVKDALNQGKEYDYKYFERFKTGTALKPEDLKGYKYSASGSDILDRLKMIYEQGYEAEIFLTDIDNDGSDEITVSWYEGGTMGIVYFTVLKRDDQGKYSEAVNSNYERGITYNLNNNLNIVRLGNKNYLLVEEADYSDKTFSGISIYSFIEGKYAESATVDLYSKETYTNTRGSYSSQYNEYINSINIEDLIKITKDGDVKSGAAEKLKPAHPFYEADINNDCKNEILEKHYYLTSTYYTPSLLSLTIKSSYPEFDKDPIKAITGIDFNQDETYKILQQFWCNSFHQKNLINILYRDNSDPVFHLDVYLLEGGRSVKVGWVKATPDVNIDIKYCKYSLEPVKD